ncbi:hypothetical protein [Paraburkholderia hospita]|uniref:hypothetical protein n=1 Tax=Paraburkholderia hospita TaxID=169430 RepID=UPI001EE65D68|nr:hypothetical protein [Paraburkholderia hospita]
MASNLKSFKWRSLEPFDIATTPEDAVVPIFVNRISDDLHGIYEMKSDDLLTLALRN